MHKKEREGESGGIFVRNTKINGRGRVRENFLRL
jgi:hypothetical protein